MLFLDAFTNYVYIRDSVCEWNMALNECEGCRIGNVTYNG